MEPEDQNSLSLIQRIENLIAENLKKDQQLSNLNAQLNELREMLAAEQQLMDMYRDREFRSTNAPKPTYKI